MWEKTLIAAAVASVTLPARAQEPVQAPAAAQNTQGNNSGATELGRIRVEGEEEEGLKAEAQTTSSKLDLSLRETPQSVTVITQESLKARQVVDFGQALELSAGVNQFSGTGPFAGQAGFGFNETTIRGIEIDPLHDVREDGYINTTYYALPDMAIYDRLEIIKGPNSVVYGRGSAGGLINRIRKKPLDDPQAEVGLSVGSFDTYRVDADLTGPLSSSGDLRGRLVAAYEDEGSFVEGIETERVVLAPSLDFNLTPDTRVLVEALYQSDGFIPNTGVPLVEGENGRFSAPRVPRTRYIGIPTAKKNDWNIYTGSAQIEQSLGDGWLATLRLNRNKTDTPIDVDRYAYGFDNGYTALIHNDFDIDRDIWAGELKLSGDIDIGGKPLKLAIGYERNDNDYHRRGAYAYLGFVSLYAEDFSELPDQPLTPGFEYTTRNKSEGYYLQAQFRPIDRLAVLAGVRRDSADSEYFAITTDSLSTKKDSDTTGRLGLTYDVTDRISVYGLYAQSFSPVIFDVDQEGNILDPETGEIFEVGVKSEWFEGRLGANAAIYRIDRENIPVGAEVGPGDVPYSVSSGLQRSEGAEIEINGEPLPGWKISGAYNWLDSEFKDPLDPFFGIKPGGTADWQLGLFTSYELQEGMLRGLGFGATVFAIDDRGVSTFVPGTLDGYERVDLNVFYQGLPSWELALTVRNALDERYIEGADRTSAYGMFGSPTAFLFSAVHKFGQ
jgi:iron complex outermembrane receptor protein